MKITCAGICQTRRIVPSLFIVAVLSRLMPAAAQTPLPPPGDDQGPLLPEGGPRGMQRGDRRRPPIPAIVSALDLNGDGVIDADEIARASQSLLKLDRNGDGKLTPDEYMRPNFGGPGANRGTAEYRRPAPKLGTASSVGDLPAMYRQFTNVIEIYRDGDYAVIRTTDVPNHPSVYFPASDPRHADYDGPNGYFRHNPGEIREQDIEFHLPLHPEKAETHRMTPLGPFGIAVNGVVLFNQFAAGRKTLTFERNSFDQYNGHPTPDDTYHYHVEPLYVTQTKGRDALVGILLDGFPIYGPEESGRTLSNADLDDFHGHFGPTKEYPQGIYHYHLTAEVPYMNGGEFYGTAGYVSH